MIARALLMLCGAGGRCFTGEQGRHETDRRLSKKKRQKITPLTSKESLVSDVCERRKTLVFARYFRLRFFSHFGGDFFAP
jgi:hypothetical protein